MKRIRRFEILKQCKDWQNIFPEMSLKNCFDTLLQDRMITKKEFKYIIDWITI
jgi:hypothetical protein